MAANWVGAYVAGLLVAWFTQIPDLAPAWRLFLMTGLLGGLTTFSTFSVEALHLMQRGTLPLALAHIGLHVIGSLLFCYAGYETLHR